MGRGACRGGSRYDDIMGSRRLVLVCMLLPACSFAFVKDLNESARTNPDVPLDCTTSRTLPTADLVIGAALAGLVAGVTYGAVERFNEQCTNGSCYTPWKPALLASFLVVSPWWIAAIVGYSDTGRCRAAFRERGQSPL